MLFETVVAGIILGLLLGGNLKNFFKTKIKYIFLLLISVAASLLPTIPTAGAFFLTFGNIASYIFCFVRYGSLLAFIYFNRRYFALIIIGAGGFLNMLVTLANNGKMPVLQADVSSASANGRELLLEKGYIINYRLADSHTQLAFLCDKIPLRGISTYLLSVGDIFIVFGIFIFIITLMKPKILSN